MASDTHRPIPAVGSEKDFEWINAWAAERSARSDLARYRPEVERRAEPTFHKAPRLVAISAAPVRRRKSDADELAFDLAEIERAHDALRSRLGAVRAPAGYMVTLGPRRTGDLVPVVLGALIGMLMLLVFSTAAMFLKIPH